MVRRSAWSPPASSNAFSSARLAIGALLLVPGEGGLAAGVVPLAHHEHVGELGVHVAQPEVEPGGGDDLRAGVAADDPHAVAGDGGAGRDGREEQRQRGRRDAGEHPDPAGYAAPGGQRRAGGGCRAGGAAGRTCVTVKASPP